MQCLGKMGCQKQVSQVAVSKRQAKVTEGLIVNRSEYFLNRKVLFEKVVESVHNAGSHIDREGISE